MQLSDIVFRNCILTDVQAATKEEALRQIFEVLYREEKVRETFYDAVLAREAEYPTGLALPGCNVAIPHVVPEHVKSSALGIAVLRNPVVFDRMDDQNLKVDVQVIFNIALAKEDKQIETLQCLMSMVTNQSVMEAVRKAGSPEEIESILRKAGSQ